MLSIVKALQMNLCKFVPFFYPYVVDATERIAVARLPVIDGDRGTIAVGIGDEDGGRGAGGLGGGAHDADGAWLTVLS